LAEGTKAIINLGLEKVPVPGESGFPFPGLFADPQSQKEAGKVSFMIFFPGVKLV
jgi:actin related protein 2/3 complex subunit 3